MSSPWTPQGKTPINFNGIKGLPPGAITAGAVIIALGVILLSTYFTIDQGERGVILHNGAIAGEAEPGLHFKMPIITSIAKISVQIQKEAFEKTGESFFKSSTVVFARGCSSRIRIPSPFGRGLG